MRQLFLDSTIDSSVAPGLRPPCEVFSLFALPGLQADYQVGRADSLYTPDEIRHLDEAGPDDVASNLVRTG